MCPLFLPGCPWFGRWTAFSGKSPQCCSDSVNALSGYPGLIVVSVQCLRLGWIVFDWTRCCLYICLLGLPVRSVGFAVTFCPGLVALINLSLGSFRFFIAGLVSLCCDGIFAGCPCCVCILAATRSSRFLSQCGVFLLFFVFGMTSGAVSVGDTVFSIVDILHRCCSVCPCGLFVGLLPVCLV